MSQLLTASDLNLATCEHPGCTENGCSGKLIITSRCHPPEPPRAWYHDGVLTFICSICENEICQVKVANG